MTATRPAGGPPAVDLDRPGDRLASLSGLRWLGALAIFLSHTEVFMPVPYASAVFDIGSSTFFFVLSGFALAWSYSARDTRAWFWSKRFAAIWPLVVVAAVLPAFFALAFPDPNLDLDESKVVWLTVSSVLLVLAWVPAQLESPNPVMWFVSALAFFYLLFPALIRPVLRRNLRQLAILAGVCLLVAWGLRIWLWIAFPPPAELDRDQLSEAQWLIFGYYSPVARLQEFVLGMVTAVAVRRGWRAVSVPTAFGLLLAAGIGLWFFREADWRIAVPYDARTQVTLPLFALLIAAVAVRDRTGRTGWLASSPMSRLGRLSYSFYLFQFLVLVPIALALFPDRTVVDFFFDPVPARWSHLTWVGVGLVGTLAFAWVMHRLVEVPAGRWLRARLARRYGPQPARSGR